MNRIIFLDVDGVLNSAQTWKGPHADYTATLDPDMCDIFADIVKKTEATVVLSSTWRLFKDSRGFIKLVQWLADRDIVIHSFTPNLHKAAGWSDSMSFTQRGNEIAIWLENHREEFPNPSFVIIDDDSDMLPSQKLFFVHTTFRDGLTVRHADKAIRILCEDNLTLGEKSV